MIKKIINKLVAKSGYKLYKFSNYPSTYKHYLESFESFGSEREWMQVMLYGEIYSQIADIPGDIAEFGVASGTSLKAFIRFTEILNKSLPHPVAKKSIYGFDAFEGLPSLSDYDHTDHSNVHEGEFLSSGSLSSLKKFVSKYKFAHLVEGYFQETLPSFIQNNTHVVFSLVHIDCDIYSSTKEVLDLILNRVAIGGIVLFDEIFHPDYPGETQGFLDAFNNLHEKNQYTFKFIRSKSMPWKWYLIRLN